MTSQQTNRARYGLTLHILEKESRSKKSQSGDAATAQIDSDIVFDPKILDTYSYNGWRSVHHDLLVVCAAVEFADRRCARHTAQWARSFNISIPVREPAAWKEPKVQGALCDALRHLTGDDWHFSFVQSKALADSVTRQRSLPFGNNKQFVIAYSDGLDSRSVSGLFDTDDAAIRVRVTKNKGRIKPQEEPFDLIPFSIKMSSSPESSVRSRGFKFSSITAIAGQISSISRIIVPESGQGALGPALLPLHNIYADYRNHPTFFRKMEQFIKALLQYEVTYEQPRLWYTKGQTIAAFVTQSGHGADFLNNTRSCWQQRWNARSDGKLRQCGLCAACLLRRMSMHFAGILEPVGTYIFSDLTTANYEASAQQNDRKRQSSTMLEYGSVGARHLQQLADMADLPDSALRPHTFEIARAISALEKNTHDNLRKLLVQHAKEWRDFVEAQGPHSFIRNWTKGGLRGRFE